MDESEKAVAIYEEIAELYAKKFTNTSDYIDKFLDLVSNEGKILDVGCGYGVDANYMQSKGFSVIGIDLSKEMIKLAKEIFPELHFKIMDMRKLDFQPNYFDGIFVAYSLIHIPKRDVVPALKSLYRILKDSGIIYIALQLGKSQEIFLKEPLQPNKKIFLNIFSEDEIINILKEIGFSIAETYKREAKNKEEFEFTKFFIIAKK